MSSSAATAVRFGPSLDSTLQIPTAIAVKNSKILPIYDTIPEFGLPQPPNARRVAWNDNADDRVYSYVDDVSAIDRDRNASREADNHLSFNTQPSLPKRTYPRLNRSFEEQALDKTVQWAMENFGFSETGNTEIA